VDMQPNGREVRSEEEHQSRGDKRLRKISWRMRSELHKQVDPVMLSTRRTFSLIRRPRPLSESGSVNWFRFWFQVYEDPGPSNLDQ